MQKQWAEIDALNEKLKGIRIFKGTECDILEDGSLDFDDELLAGFDYVVAASTRYFNMPEEEMTARVCKALSHPAADDARPRHRPAAAQARRLQDRPRRSAASARRSTAR